MIDERRQPATRLDSIHLLRGLASLSVCMMHVSVGTPFIFPPSVLALANLGQFGVPVFFIISGFVVPLSLSGRNYGLRNFPRYFARRMVRLDPPYFAVIAFALALAAFRTVRAGVAFPYTGSDVALHVGYLTGLAGRTWIVSTFWTLGIEFQFYLMMGLVFSGAVLFARLLTTPSSRGLLLLGSVLAAFFILDGSGKALQSWMGDERFVSVWFHYQDYFLIGIGALVVRRTQTSVIGLAIFCAIILLWHQMPAWVAEQRVDWGQATFWAMVVPFGMFIAGTRDQFAFMHSRGIGAWLSHLGTISYSLYVTHGFVVGVMVSRAVKRGWLAPGHTGVVWCVFALEVGVCLVIASAFYRLVERPALRWSHRIRF